MNFNWITRKSFCGLVRGKYSIFLPQKPKRFDHTGSLTQLHSLKSICVSHYATSSTAKDNLPLQVTLLYKSLIVTLIGQRFHRQHEGNVITGMCLSGVGTPPPPLQMRGSLRETPLLPPDSPLGGTTSAQGAQSIFKLPPCFIQHNYFIMYHANNCCRRLTIIQITFSLNFFKG